VTNQQTDQQTDQQTAPKRAVGFRSASTVTRTVAPDGYEPFEITFAVPSAGAEAAFRAGMLDEDCAARGRQLVRFVSSHLESWSLDRDCTQEAVDSLDDAAVLLAVFQEIIDAAESEKN